MRRPPLPHLSSSTLLPPLHPLHILLTTLTTLLLLLQPSPTLAAKTQSSLNQPSLFCKCTCFNNSTIIDLAAAGVKTTAGTCSDCNRGFCLGYNLPICKNAKEEDVVTTCFQRDSTKDMLVVFIFIVATVGLLGFALVRPWIGAWIAKARGGEQQRQRERERGRYQQVPASGR